jgi:hypothetical protein
MIGIEPSDTPLERKEFNKHYDNFLVTGQLNPDAFAEMDAWQQFACNELKKAFIRLEKKNENHIH